MQINRKDKTFSLSPRDLALMNEAGIGFPEMAKCEGKHPGLPPLWSRIPYLMLLHSAQTTTQAFWRSYREFDTLLKTRDSHYSPAQIPKEKGGVRELMIPDWALRRHQRFIQKNILYKIPVSAHACAYHKYRGLTDLAEPHIGHKTLIHLDIQDFFTSITEQMVFEALYRETGYPKSVAGFLSRLCCYRRYLPQGACTSPALSNICFKKCDDKIAQLARRNQLTYTRYSDDLYLSGDEVDAVSIIRQVRVILAENGFQIRSDKTKVLGKHQAQMVTAIVVNEKMQVSRQYRRKLRQEIYYLKKFRHNAEAAIAADSFDGYLYQLLGKISFVLYVDPDNEEFLEAKEMVERMQLSRRRWLPF